MLGSLEKKVVAVLEEKETATIGELLEELRDRNVEVAYTTVSTVLNRLYEKDMVSRHKEPYRGGSRYVYEYVDIRDEYISRVVENLTTVFGEKGAANLMERVDVEQDLSDVRDDLGIE